MAILNDLQAQGQALGHIPAANLRAVIPGSGEAGHDHAGGGALGTGVNAAPVHPLSHGRIVPPSECGHVNMPVRSEEDFQLARFIEAKLKAEGEVPHAGVEEVLAGRGLANLHAFAAYVAGHPSSPTSGRGAGGAGRGRRDRRPCCPALCAHPRPDAADLALIHLLLWRHLPDRRHVPGDDPAFRALRLEAAFREDRRVDLLRTDFAITVVEDDYAALTGCAAYLNNAR